MTTILQRLASITAAFVLTACGGGSSGTSESTTVVAGGSTPAPSPAPTPTPAPTPAPSCSLPSSLRVDALPTAAASASDATLQASKRAAVADPVRIVLGPLTDGKALSVTPSRLQQRQQIGVARRVAGTASAELTTAKWAWTTLPHGGKAAALSFTSDGAAGVRLGVLVDQLPAAAVVRFHVPGTGQWFSVTGAAVLDALALNTQSEGGTAAARTYWSPTLEGPEAVMEVELPAGVPTGSVQVSVPQLSHLRVMPQSDLSVLKATTASCEIDVNCSTGFATESNAIARVTFVASDGGTYVCTGTLLNDRAGTKTPYFLTANHCVSTQSEASSVNAYWFYRSASCNASTVSSSAKLTVGGAALLYASAASDTSFMRLNVAPPAGVTFAGWDASVPTTGTAVVGLHNPSGGLQKISYGSTQGYLSCSAIGAAETFSCAGSTVTAGKFLLTGWSRGVTETGSSGSGIFKTVGTSNYLIGQLYGGSSSCTNPTGQDSYGRFDVAYTAALSKWLDPTACVTP